MLQENPTSLIVVAAALVRADERICLQRRPAAKMHGGLWEFPGGKIEPGETPESALIREIAEELGITLDPANLVPAAFAGDGGDRTTGKPAVVILLYSCREWAGEPEAIEAEAAAWFAPHEISALAMPPLDYPLAEALIRLLAAGAI